MKIWTAPEPWDGKGMSFADNRIPSEIGAYWAQLEFQGDIFPVHFDGKNVNYFQVNAPAHWDTVVPIEFTNLRWGPRVMFPDPSPNWKAD